MSMVVFSLTEVGVGAKIQLLPNNLAHVSGCCQSVTTRGDHSELVNLKQQYLSPVFTLVYDYKLPNCPVHPSLCTGF